MMGYTRRLVKTMRQLFDDKEPLIGAEIGVWQGQTSEALLSSFELLFLYMVDPWEKVPNTETMKKKTKDELIEAKELARKSTEFAASRRQIVWDTSEDAFPQVDMPLDFVFIDANHMYDFVKKDIELWEKRLKAETGILSGHDYGGKGDRAKGWGVSKAVDEFASKVGCEVNLIGGSVWWMRKEWK